MKINGYEIKPGGLRGTMRRALAAAKLVAPGVNLEGADLSGANLMGANLRGANLEGADLRGARLETANLLWANLRGANLGGARLRDANLSNAVVTGLSPENIGLPPSDGSLAKRVARAILDDPEHLDMGFFHRHCNTTHCLAGWAIHLSGPAGYALEGVTSPSVAGCLLMPEAGHLFYSNNEAALEWCRRQLSPTDTAEGGGE